MASLFLPHVRVGALTAEYKEFARDTKTQSKVLATTVGVSGTKVNNGNPM